MPSTLGADVSQRRANAALAATSLVLVGALAALGWWQYRAVSRASAAERDRMQAVLVSRAAQFERDLDREVTRAFVWLQADTAGQNPQGGHSIVDRLARWYESAPHPDLLDHVYVVREVSGSTSPATTRFDRTSGQMVDATLPEGLSEAVGRLTARERDRDARFSGRRMRPGLVVDADGPALVVGRPWFRRGRAPGVRPVGEVEPATDGDLLAVVARLDEAYLSSELLPKLAAEHFPPDEHFAFRLRIVRSADGSVVFEWPDGQRGDRRDRAARGVDYSRPDATVDLLHVRPEDFARFLLAPPPQGAPVASPAQPRSSAPDERIEIVVVPPREPRTAAQQGDAVALASPGGRPAPWQMALVHRDGSLDAAVARARRWNLGATLAMLGILGAGLAAVLLASRRAQRLAHERLEFVAGVSHELRTPLSVIRSAAENLADGVVAEPPQVRQYGTLIADEGRRLTSMVDDVMTFAGLESGKTPLSREAVDVAGLIAACRERVAADLETAGIQLEIAPVEPDLLVEGDREALVRVLVNLVGNAVKYAADGGWVGVSVSSRREGGRTLVALAVADRGPGIPLAERARVFEPFFRGADAVGQQVHGSGLGLSLVRRSVERHGGRVTIAPNSPTGTVFTVTLPMAAPRLLPDAGLRNEAPAVR